MFQAFKFQVQISRNITSAVLLYLYRDIKKIVALI